MSMHLENAAVVEHTAIQGGYKLLWMHAPSIAPMVHPGQFLHVLVPHLGEAVLRRPFSVFRAEEDKCAILYKDVGKGTRTLSTLRAGETVSLIGPLGNGYPGLAAGKFPLLVAGGYGMAALYLVARRMPVQGVAFFGGRASKDILCIAEFQALGWDVRVSTEDGSLGHRGLVTDMMERWFQDEQHERIPELFACGPNGMLQAVADLAHHRDVQAWVSMDSNMGCGVGACLTCVVKVKDGDDWTWSRSCREGPVYDANHILWDKTT